MSGISHFREHRESHFHPHPLHTIFALVTSVLLALLLMLLVLVPSAK